MLVSAVCHGRRQQSTKLFPKDCEPLFSIGCDFVNSLTIPQERQNKSCAFPSALLSVFHPLVHYQPGVSFVFSSCARSFGKTIRGMSLFSPAACYHAKCHRSKTMVREGTKLPASCNHLAHSHQRWRTCPHRHHLDHVPMMLPCFCCLLCFETMASWKHEVTTTQPVLDCLLGRRVVPPPLPPNEFPKPATPELRFRCAVSKLVLCVQSTTPVPWVFDVPDCCSHTVVVKGTQTKRGLASSAITSSTGPESGFQSTRRLRPRPRLASTVAPASVPC